MQPTVAGTLRPASARLSTVFFCFIDSDTFVRGDVSPIFSLNVDIAGACNNSRDEFTEQVYEPDAETMASMKWSVGGRVFLNSGVLFYNETPGARRFATLLASEVA